MRLILGMFVIIISCSDPNSKNHGDVEGNIKNKNTSIESTFDWCDKIKVELKQECIKGDDPRHFCFLIKEGLKKQSPEVFYGFWSSSQLGHTGLRYNIKQDGKVEIMAYRMDRDGGKSDEDFLEKAKRYPLPHTSITIANKHIIYKDFLIDETSKDQSSNAHIDLYPLNVMKKILTDKKKSGITQKVHCATEPSFRESSGLLEVDGYFFYKTLKEHYVGYEVDIDLNEL